jgi:hypothetical protein
MTIISSPHFHLKKERQMQTNIALHYSALVTPLGAVIAQLITITQIFLLSKRQPTLILMRSKRYLYAAIISNILYHFMWMYKGWLGGKGPNSTILSYINDAIVFSSLMLIWLLEIEAWR